VQVVQDHLENGSSIWLTFSAITEQPFELSR